jgi:hypothetical protein
VRAALAALLLLGALTWPATAAAKAGCDGAAARAPGHRCGAARPGAAVDPAPSEAGLQRGSPCVRGRRDGLAQPCSFGAPAKKAKRTVALIGDSHAAHWRTALAAVAARERWRVFALTRNSCPFSATGRGLPKRDATRCTRWKRDVAHWLRAHPKVTTVMLAQEVSDVDTAGAADPFAAAVQSYVTEWQTLPASVTHVVVLRDTPLARPDVLNCVRRHALPQVACALPEAVALPPDPAVAAATRLGAPRFQTVDLTGFFCDGTSCFPVVGGVLVYLDSNHLTPRFVSTLAPYLDAQLHRL